ncbi:MAG: polyprenyl synthetase family protein [Chromatiales bacterium]|nr:polyprenyl synthetase family protein [Chromatiales bacterium]
MKPPNPRTSTPATDDPLTGFRRFCRSRVEAALDRALPGAGIAPVHLHEAMRYATLGPGKRVRAMLVYAAGQACGVMPARLDAIACAVELIHAYSLVHDDLPAMDDDDLRRGRPSCHREFDEATAILAGDALQALAFQILAEDPALAVPAERRLEMLSMLALAAGSRGMVGGQALDLEAIGVELDLAALENMHIHKTGALIRAAVAMAGLAATNCSVEARSSLDHYGKCIGLAFQIRDDILDVTRETRELGKTAGKDQRNNKPTYTSALGLAAARERAIVLHTEALAALLDFDATADPLRWIADFVVQRER